MSKEAGEIIKHLDKLTNEKKVEVFSKYCVWCGDKNPKCQCSNDE